jgi:hypothetical protein
VWELVEGVFATIDAAAADVDLADDDDDDWGGLQIDRTPSARGIDAKGVNDEDDRSWSAPAPAPSSS